MVVNSHALNPGAHVGLLKKLFPNGRFLSLHPVLKWRCDFKPMPLSETYTIQVCYTMSLQPLITVTGKKLDMGSAKKLPHVHSTRDQVLCLHYPPEKKWTPRHNIANTIVPWAAEWLFHYEIWLNTGQWNGGGTVHGLIDY